MTALFLKMVREDSLPGASYDRTTAEINGVTAERNFTQFALPECFDYNKCSLNKH